MVNNSESTFSYNYVHVFFFKQEKKKKERKTVFVERLSSLLSYFFCYYTRKSMVNTGPFPGQFNESFPWNWLKIMKIIYIELVQE